MALFALPDGRFIEPEKLGGIYRNEANEHYEFRDGFKYNGWDADKFAAVHGANWRDLVRTLPAWYTSQLPMKPYTERRPGPIDPGATWIPSTDLTKARSDLDRALIAVASGAAGAASPAAGAAAAALSVWPLPVSPLVALVIVVAAYFVFKKVKRS